MKVLGIGAWLAWLVYTVGKERHGDVPPRWFMRWNTRSVNKINMGQWYRERGRRDMTLYRHEEAILWRLDITPHVGQPYTLWEIDHDFTRGTALYGAEKSDPDGVRHMNRVDFYSDAAQALRVFHAIAHGPGGYYRTDRPGEPTLTGGAWFHITEGCPHVLYADDAREPLDIIDLTGRDVHAVIEEWLAGRLAAGLPRTSYEAERLAES